MSNDTPVTDKAWEEARNGGYGGMQDMAACSRQLERELAEAKRENTILRGLLPKMPVKCPYCGLDNMGMCKSGFPGCAWADDLMCGEDEAFRNILKERDELHTKLDAAMEALKELDGIASKMQLALEEYGRLVANGDFYFTCKAHMSSPAIRAYKTWAANQTLALCEKGNSK